jgi:hypothetical protein
MPLGVQIGMWLLRMAGTVVLTTHYLVMTVSSIRMGITGAKGMATNGVLRTGPYQGRYRKQVTLGY